LTAVLFPIGIAALVALLALALVQLIHQIVLRIGRRSVMFTDLARRAHRPVQATLALIAVYYAVRDTTDPADWRTAFLHGVQLFVIGAVAWLVGALLLVIEDAALARWRTDVSDNRKARRVHTQVVMIRRVTLVVVGVLAFGVALMTFPQARVIGTSVLASAGFAGIIAALAAQSVLRNIFAGLQLAFSDAVRLGDVVIVQGEWGRIEEITLSYVVVHIWDDRRLILPTSYLTETPFENWTRTDAALLGSVEFDVDWGLPVDEMREELRQCLGRTDLWDERVSVLQVTEATAAAMKVRALVSAADAPRLWDLRCYVREHLVNWVRTNHPSAMPRLRAELTSVDDLAAAERLTQPGVVGGVGSRPLPKLERNENDQRVFSGGEDADARGDAFVGPPPAERSS
jgi:hypothetical protein